MSVKEASKKIKFPNLPVVGGEEAEYRVGTRILKCIEYRGEGCWSCSLSAGAVKGGKMLSNDDITINK